MNGQGDRRGGFTLIELLVVAAVMAVLGMAAVYNVVARAPHYRMDDARLQLIGDLRGARQAAVTRSAPAYISFETSLKRYTIWVDADRDGAVDTGERTVRQLPVYKGMTMSATMVQGTFSAMGTWSSAPRVGRVSLTMSPVGTQTIYITPSGEVDCDV